MPRYLVTLNQKSAGLLFSSRYYISATEVGVDADIDGLVQLQSQIQTVDVEYLNCTARNLDVVPNITHYVPLTSVQGVNTGQTAPVANFLTMVLIDANGRQHRNRVRGFVIDDLTGDTVFNIGFAGDTDQPNTSLGDAGTAESGSGYGGYLAQYLQYIVSKFASSSFEAFTGYSQRASVGSKAIRRTY